MIEDKKVATELVNVINECYEKLDGTVPLVKENCSVNEVMNYSRLVGQVMASLSLDIRDAIYEMHPELKPDNYDTPFTKMS